MMVDKPSVIVKVCPANQWSAQGPAARRAMAWARKALAIFQPHSSCAFHLEVIASPTPHTGLGTGTQLALAIAKAIRTACDLPDLRRAADSNVPSPPPAQRNSGGEGRVRGGKFLSAARLTLPELALAMGRGRRSAIGSYGFQSGGLILETGHDATGNLGKLQQRISVPTDWRIILITPRAEHGCHGRLESEAFAQLGTMSQTTSNRLLELATCRILPAALRNDPATFDQAVYQYGLLAGECFTPVQGGPFASTATTRRVEALRHLGIHGVGQSSWGPTLFAFLRNDSPGALIAKLTPMPEFAGCDFLATGPDNRGAVMTVHERIVEQ